jgi:uncharacterized protein related to proFAR isomerase
LRAGRHVDVAKLDALAGGERPQAILVAMDVMRPHLADLGHNDDAPNRDRLTIP